MTEIQELEDLPIEELAIGARAYNCLKRYGFVTIGDVTSKTGLELRTMVWFGEKSLLEVEKALAEFGLGLTAPGWVAP